MPHLVSAPRLDCCLSFGKVNKIKFKLVKFRKSFWENSSLFSYLPARIPFLLSSVLAIPFIAFNKLQKSYPTLAAIFSEMNPSSLAWRAWSLKLFLHSSNKYLLSIYHVPGTVLWPQQYAWPTEQVFTDCTVFSVETENKQLHNWLVNCSRDTLKEGTQGWWESLTGSSPCFVKVIFRDGISRCDLKRCISRPSEAGVTDRTLAKGTTARTKLRRGQGLERIWCVWAQCRLGTRGELEDRLDCYALTHMC